MVKYMYTQYNGGNMKTITILKWASFENLPDFKKLCQKHLWTLKEVTMNYNPSDGLPFRESIENWPFRAVFEENGELIEVRIFSLTVGYRGAGPKDFISILDYLGVSYDENDIYTKRRMGPDGFIRLHYVL